MLSRRLLRVKVAKTLYAHLKSGSDSLKASENNLVQSIDKAYDLYFQMMDLIVEVARYAESRIELAKQKKLPTYEDLNPNRRFVDNAVIHLIANSDSVNDYLAERKLSWALQQDAIRDVFNRLVETEFYKKYMTQPVVTFTDDRKFVEEFFQWLEEDEALAEVVTEMSLLWADDYGFALFMALRTVQNTKQSHDMLRVLPKFKSDEDLDFARTLLIKSLVQYEDNQEIVDRYTQNWDVERVPLMDRIIMQVALAEITSCPTIPLSVSINEYIEIAKSYSTPNSARYINATLDNISKKLIADRKLIKNV